MKTSSKFTLSLAIFALSSLLGTNAFAAWDVTINSAEGQLLAAADSFASDGELRFAKQLISLDKPDANGFLYTENIAQYSCTKSKYQLVMNVGFKTWDDTGTSIDSSMGKWHSIQAGSVQESMLNKLCNTSVAGFATTQQALSN